VRGSFVGNVWNIDAGSEGRRTRQRKLTETLSRRISSDISALRQQYRWVEQPRIICRDKRQRPSYRCLRKGKNKSEQRLSLPACCVFHKALSLGFRSRSGQMLRDRLHARLYTSLTTIGQLGLPCNAAQHQASGTRQSQAIVLGVPGIIRRTSVVAERVNTLGHSVCILTSWLGL
jgi:hypothetical protein